MTVVENLESSIIIIISSQPAYQLLSSVLRAEALQYVMTAAIIE